eukprot:scaffold106847_cov27-Tisochrysis_lutea.AAC.1
MLQATTAMLLHAPVLSLAVPLQRQQSTEMLSFRPGGRGAGRDGPGMRRGPSASCVCVCACVFMCVRARACVCVCVCVCVCDVTSQPLEGQVCTCSLAWIEQQPVHVLFGESAIEMLCLPDPFLEGQYTSCLQTLRTTLLCPPAAHGPSLNTNKLLQCAYSLGNSQPCRSCACKSTSLQQYERTAVPWLHYELSTMLDMCVHVLFYVIQSAP